MRPMGRPTLYDPAYCAAVEAFFNRPMYEERERVITLKNGTEIKEIQRLPVAFPTLAGFARMIGVHRDTLHAWMDQHVDFSDAVKRAKESQEELLVNGAMLGLYDARFSVLVAKNYLSFRDKVEHDGLPKDGAHITVTHEGTVTLSPADTLMEMLRQGPGPKLVGSGTTIDQK